MAMRSMIESSDHDGELEKELGALLREQRGHEASDREEELSIYRSGSAPPTVQGSLNAVGGLFGEAVPALRFQNGGGGENGFVTDEELRSDPAYISYYYSNVNLNPRLPPPLLSREEVRFAQRFHGRGSGSVVGEIGDRGKTNMTGDGGGGTGSSSFFSMQKQDNVVESGKSAEWGGDGLIGLPGLGLGGRKKSIAEIIQDDLNHAKLASKHPSRPASRNAFDEEVETSERQFALLHHELASMDSLQSASGLQNFGSSAAHSYASAVGSSLSRSTTPDLKLAARATSPCAQLVVGDRSSSLNKRATNISNSFGAVSPGFSEPADVVAAMSRMSLLTNDKVEEGPKNQHDINNGPNLFDLPTDPNHIKRGFDFNIAGSGNSVHSFSQPVNPSFLKGPSPVPAVSNVGSLPSLYQNMNVTNSSFPNYAYSVSPSSPSMVENQLGIRNLPPLYENAAASAIAVSGMDPRAFGGNFGGGPNILAAAPEANHPSGNTLQIPFVDPLYLQYLRSTEYAAAQAGAITEPTVDREYMASLYMDLVQKALYGASPSSHKSQFGAPYVGKSASLSHNYYGNPAFGMGPILPNSPIGSSSPIRHGERNLRFSSGSRNLSGPLMGPWGPEAGGGFDESFASSLLNEFKSNKTRCFELFEISGHVVEFSADQYGSRFIQQKLETATADEREMVFHEIMPHALSLMTDVFGNYVVQKFFEHGTPSQIRDLADQLTGHVLTSSLQMYGCRVIQKAIEVVELDQQIKMVAELDGHVMRCVRDQNGNHVIQKCIECVPEDSILFIISTFYDQIVSLSTHPYGCRVVQRILEHCRNPKTLGVVMKEILDSVCRLAQDQYGNYVIQHVLEHGKPEERSAIIKKLTGQIVQMSQQKFASNVVEKCLSYGNPVERQILVNEMLGCSAENEPLQAMMKDQFANYVVQKVLETCDDQQLQQILNRIKVHLNALKKYTYGKHIVARVEKLVAAGEKRISVLCPNSTA